MSKEAMKLAQATLEAIATHCDLACVVTPEGAFYLQPAIAALREALAEQPAQQEPVALLANGTRFKISYDSRQSGGQIHGIPPELGGRWVAFVAADDDCHLKLTSPPAQRKPLTVEEIEALLPEPDGTAEVDSVRVLVAPGLYGTEYSEADAWTKESVIQVARAIEAKLKEKNT